MAVLPSESKMKGKYCGRTEGDRYEWGRQSHCIQYTPHTVANSMQQVTATGPKRKKGEGCWDSPLHSAFITAQAGAAEHPLCFRPNGSSRWVLPFPGRRIKILLKASWDIHEDRSQQSINLKKWKLRVHIRLCTAAGNKSRRRRLTTLQESPLWSVRTSSCPGLDECLYFLPLRASNHTLSPFLCYFSLTGHKTKLGKIYIHGKRLQLWRNTFVGLNKNAFLQPDHQF